MAAMEMEDDETTVGPVMEDHDPLESTTLLGKAKAVAVKKLLHQRQFGAEEQSLKGFLRIL